MPATVRAQLSPSNLPSAEQTTTASRSTGKSLLLTRPQIRVGAFVGLVAIAAAAASLWMAPDLRGVFGAGLAALMVAIAVVDAKRFIIPNALTAAGLGLGIVHALIAEPGAVGLALAMALLRGSILALLFLSIKMGYRRLRGREGLGWGDVKLAGVAGVWLDWATLPIAVEIAALAAIAIYGLRQYVLKRPVRLQGRLPFGLFLAPAIWLCWLLETRLVVPFY